jgi:hypothetical protein
MIAAGETVAWLTLATFRFWVAVLMLVDAACGLLGVNRLQQRAPRINVERLALIEAAAALLILYIHFFVDPRP